MSKRRNKNQLPSRSMASGSPVSQPGRPVPQKLVFQQRTTFTASAFPSGDELAKINASVPDGANRAFTIVENQSAHRIKIEGRVVTSNIWGERISQVGALTIALFGMDLGYQLVMAGKQIEGFVGAFAPLAILAGLFLAGRKQRDRDLNAKDPRQIG